MWQSPSRETLPERNIRVPGLQGKEKTKEKEYLTMEKLNEELIREQIVKELDDRNVPRMCENCTKWHRPETLCTRIGKRTALFMTCNDHEFKTEKLEREAKEYIKAEQLECDKIENLLALAITTANLTTCYVEDVEKKTKKLYNIEKEKRQKQLLRKDITMAEDIDKAMLAIAELLRKIDQQYRFYIQPHIDRALMGKERKFDERRWDSHMNNSLEFGRLLIKFTKKCLYNEGNSNKVFAFLDSLVNDVDYALTDKDAEHYKLKE